MDRPYVTINAAMSCDGKLASRTRAKFRFSNEEDSKAIDQIRRDSDAVLVGATTLARDNPRLVLQYDENRQYRLQRGLPENPVKATISPSCDLDPGCQFLIAGDGKKYVFTTARAPAENIARIQPLAIVVQHDMERVDVLLLLQKLYEDGIRKLLIEGGGSTNFEFIRNKVVDELRIAVAPVVVGGSGAPTLVDGEGFDQKSASELLLVGTEVFDQMVILRYKFRDVIATE